MSFGMYSPASSAFTGSPASFHLQASMFPESDAILGAPSGAKDLSSFIEQLSLPLASRLTPVEQLQNTPMLMGDASSLPLCNDALYAHAAASCPGDIASSLSMLSMPFGSPLDAGVFLGIHTAMPSAPLAAWGMPPAPAQTDQQVIAHHGMVLYPDNSFAAGSGASLMHSSPLSSADCADFQLADNGLAASNNHQTPAVSHYPPLFCLNGDVPAPHTPQLREPNCRSSATIAAGSHHGRPGIAHTPLDFAAPYNAPGSVSVSPPLDGYASENSGSHMPRARSSSSSWKNQPRNSISKRQKLVFYKWLLENTRFPFPSDEERLGRLAVEPMSEKQFKYWFANIRCRQFVKHRSPNGEFFFTPNAKFYESCLRLKIEISGCIPVDVRRVMRKPRRSSN